MRVIGLAGWSGSGKTTLVTKVIPGLVKRGLKLATVKQAPVRSPWYRAADITVSFQWFSGL